MFGKIRGEFQCLEGYKKNSNILKDKITILKFKRKRKKIQSLKAWEKIAMFGRTRSEFQWLKAYKKKSNVWKDKIRLLMTRRKR